ncbi:MAG TPA: hypothetical protein VF883_18225 [Thermoanaerobaculia bacterium]|jgi:hypothetical protein
MRRLSTAAAVVFVLFVYAFFGSIGELAFPRVYWDQGFGKPADGYYASLAEGFLRGQVSMAHRPDPRLTALPHPYDYEARVANKVPYLWDASYFNGRYYLYFSPLPALLLYIPYRLAATMYPGDQFAGTLFAAWAFIMAVLFVRRALAGTTLHVPLPIWIITLGLSGVTPFVLPHCRTYEVAILCGAAMTSTWAYALLRFLQTRATRWLVWSSIWLALAVASRPHLGVLVPLFLVAVFVSAGKRAVLATVPLAIVVAALLAYNYTRFHDPFEFGLRYQLTYMPMEGHRVCGIHNVPELRRAVHNFALYTFTPPRLSREFPFVRLRSAPLNVATSFTPQSDEIGGLAPLAPLAFIGSLFAIVLAWRRRERAAVLAVAAGWLVLLGLCTCWYVSARYALDFWFLISAGAIVALERGSAAIASRPLRIAAIAVALISSLAGALLGFQATSGAFEYFNPELFHRLSRLFE